jgi:hypothetical protein
MVFYRPKHFCRKLIGMVLYRIGLTCGYLFEKVLYFIKFQKLQSLHIRALPAMQTGDFFCITSLRNSLDMFRKQTKICGLLPHIHMNKGTSWSLHPPLPPPGHAQKKANSPNTRAVENFSTFILELILWTFSWSWGPETVRL